LLDTYEPLRPDLFRYCRHLTRSPWDAEDMTQETMARAFANLGLMTEPPHNPRAWLFRVAFNLWTNRNPANARASRRLRCRATEPATGAEPRATREAAGTLIAQLSPQERAAVVLKDAFGLSLEEIAEALSTTTGAVKAALHRGAPSLVEPEPVEAATVTPAVLDAFLRCLQRARPRPFDGVPSSTRRRWKYPASGSNTGPKRQEWNLAGHTFRLSG